ncbi:MULTISPECIES: hypothetical protein [unclassified Pseudomonas]|uniref:hypothetical protein n=1 Tax=unclassified Pseudomonas TaxID=196821 RepID=UPI0021583437|nr:MULTISPECIES: hypothetical protein [unclassified Pseudomonas]
MTKANECTCPSGDGSLRWPCPAHPAEQAGGDERAAFERAFTVQEGIYFDDKRGEYRSMNLRAIEATDAQDLNLRLQGWQARAALAQPSGEVVVTKNESGAIVSVTRQDKEGRVLSVIAESATLTAQAEQAEAERPEVVAWQYRVTAGPQTGWSLWHPGKGEEFERSYTVERRPLMTVAQHERIVGELRAVIAQLRQHKNDYMDSGQETYRALQNEIREREAEIARLDGLVSGRTAERDAALARVAELEKQERPEGPTEDELEAAGLGYPLHKEEAVKLWYSGFRSEVITVLEAWEAIGHDIGMNPDKGELLDSLRYMLEKCEAHDAALARVAELERQQPVAWMHDQPNRVDVIHRDVKDLLQRVPGSSRGIYRPLDVSEHYTIPLYAAPVAQAQHSVPEGWVQSLPLKDHQPCKPNEDRANGYTIPIYSRPVLVEEALRKLRAVLCDPIGNVVIDGSDGDREEVQRALGMLAAAPGKEGV